VPVDVSSRKPKNCGRKKVEIDTSQVETIPLHRKVYHKVSSSSSRYEKNHSTSDVQRWVPKTALQLIEAIFKGGKQKRKVAVVCFNVRAAYIANSAKVQGNEEHHTPR